ncbi:exostosin domain-containing protein [Roseofilum capinflatum]|uniref:Exostosin family protein n=1 Tax=Roseofilum capinflatum BLCC-M114 TaxID=3022440 RepID=A0ABT7B8J6_9CYAN|nr:exostosin family protein [Roseofilum capinflatum]MDJ1175487.1 exostosin family protein [Roseofilum capinflatum BLCC-M114]
MKDKLRLTTLGIELAREEQFPDGCPILKAWRGNYSPHFNQVIQETLEIVETSEADGFILPSNVSFYSAEKIAEIGEIVSKLKLPAIGFDISNERRKPAWLDYIIRFSWYGSFQESGGIISPAFLNSEGFDLLAELGIDNWEPSEKEEYPTVSFCGREGGKIGLAIWRMMPKTLTRKMAANFFCGTTRGIRATCCYPLRVDTMQILEKDARIKTDFMGRGQVGMGPKEQGQRRKQFLQNLQNNAYALCSRGTDNYSWRFYEALSLGKIPILIDTDCVLPLEDEIAWDDVIVRVPSTRLPELPDRLWEWHNRFSDSEFRDLQRQLRSLFERLTPAQFYPALLKKIL